MVELFWVLDSIVVALLYHMPHQTHAGALQRLLVPRRSLPLKQITAPLIYHWATWVKRETVKQIITHRSLKLISMRTLHSVGLPLFFFFSCVESTSKNKRCCVFNLDLVLDHIPSQNITTYVNYHVMTSMSRSTLLVPPVSCNLHCHHFDRLHCLQCYDVHCFQCCLELFSLLP